VTWYLCNYRRALRNWYIIESLPIQSLVYRSAFVRAHMPCYGVDDIYIKIQVAATNIKSQYCGQVACFNQSPLLSWPNSTTSFLQESSTYMLTKYHPYPGSGPNHFAKRGKSGTNTGLLGPLLWSWNICLNYRKVSLHQISTASSILIRPPTEAKKHELFGINWCPYKGPRFYSVNASQQA
jgi:hypothetical protein